METTELYREIVDRMPGGFFVYHADGDEEIIHANQAMIRMFGCETMEEFKELTGNSFKGIVHPDDLEMAEKSIHDQIKNSKYGIDYLEYRIIKKDGTVRWVEDYGHYIETERYGGIFYVFIDDATERFNERMKHLEKVNEELKKLYLAEAQYKKALLQAALLYFEVNFTKDTFTTDVVRVVNEQPLSYFTFKNIDKIEKYSDFLKKIISCEHCENPDECIRMMSTENIIKRYERGDLEQTYDIWIVNPVGLRRLISCTVLIGRETETDDLTGLFVVRDLTDLTEGKNLFKLAIKQAKTAKTFTNEYLNDMAHEIKDPLNGIVGYADIIGQMMSDNPSIVDYTKKIKHLSRQILSVADGSLEYSKLEEGWSVLCETEGSISKFIDELTCFVKPLCKVRKLKFTSQCVNLKNDNVVADFIHLKKAIHKLLDNSVKFTDENGEVKLSVVELGDAPDGYGKYQFIVEDSGIGIEPEFMKKMFEPFEKKHQNMQGKIIGSGFGLAIVKGIVDVMNGTIDVKSEQGKGSKFVITFIFKLKA